MHEFFHPMLLALKAGASNTRSAMGFLQSHFGFSNEEMQELVPSGTRERVFDRADWALFHLMKAGYVDRPKRGLYVLSPAGQAHLLGNENHLSKEVLQSTPMYKAFLDETRNKPKDVTFPSSPVVAPPEPVSPEDQMNAAQSVNDSALRDDILTRLYEMNPVRFERLILDLLSKMGYGAGLASNARMTKTTGDGGIDGIIHEDALGLDAVYIQAKRYGADAKVGRPAMQQFVGSLTGEGATKGVFVTTSDFSREARDYLNRVQHRVVLINGAELARQMIRYEVGVRARSTYVLKGMDEDYFSEE
jgi:restriction system protein